MNELINDMKSFELSTVKKKILSVLTTDAIIYYSKRGVDQITISIDHGEIKEVANAMREINKMCQSTFDYTIHIDGTVLLIVSW